MRTYINFNQSHIYVKGGVISENFSDWLNSTNKMPKYSLNEKILRRRLSQSGKLSEIKLPLESGTSRFINTGSFLSYSQGVTAYRKIYNFSFFVGTSYAQFHKYSSGFSTFGM